MFSFTRVCSLKKNPHFNIFENNIINVGIAMVLWHFKHVSSFCDLLELGWDSLGQTFGLLDYY
jgi:hypothetical protein